MPRRLIHIPIIHTAADLGSLSEAVRAHYAKVCGRASWDRREQIVESLWADIRENLDALRLDGPKTRIYQDGLPICGFEERIVRELASAGSVNHQLIVGLLDRGAAVMGTEDPQLLMEEYELHKQSLAPAGRESAPAEHRQTRRPPARPARPVHRRSDRRHACRTAKRGCCSSAPCTGWTGLLPTDIRLETLG